MISEYGVPVIFLQAQQQTDWAMFAVSLAAAFAAMSAAVVAALSFRSSRSPDVIAYFETDIDRNCLLFVVENVGRGAAYDVNITLSRDLPANKEASRRLGKGLLGRGIPTLVSGASRRIILSQTKQAGKMLGDDQIEAEIKFFRSTRKFRVPIKNKMVLEVWSFQGIYARSYDRSIAKSLQSIARILDEADFANL